MPTTGRITSDVGWNRSYATLLQAAGSHTAAKVAGVYGIPMGDPLAVSGTGTLYPIALVYLAASEFPTPATGEVAWLRVRAELACNDVAPGGDFTVALHPVSRPVTSGGAGLCTYTIGTAVVGSGVTVTAPAADSLSALAGTDFDFPANGFYCLAVTTTATIATSAHVHINARLQVRNVVF